MSLFIPNLPFCIGATPTPLNPSGLPSTYPFCLELNKYLGRLEQPLNKDLENLLDQAYRVGNEMGTPSDNTELGRPYVDDFISFLSKISSPPGKLLEIGAGTGFLSKQLILKNWDVTSIEPGLGYQGQWKSNGIEVINDFFPSKHVTGQYDAVVFYTVLEHIKDTKTFLSNVKNHLEVGGYIFLAVPDCTVEISSNDPSILLHEHFHYFTKDSLLNTLLEAGLCAQVFQSNYGRCLYASAQISSVPLDLKVTATHLAQQLAYCDGIKQAQYILAQKLKSWLDLGTVGIFCPSRLLNLISPNENLLFYDDSPSLHGKFYPPFTSRIRNRSELFIDKPDLLLIASRTFGKKIKHDLLESGYTSHILLISDLF